MLEVLKFVFSGFWIYVGFAFLLLVCIAGIFSAIGFLADLRKPQSTCCRGCCCRKEHDDCSCN